MRFTNRTQFKSGGTCENYLGPVLASFAGYALSDEVRAAASSGGLVSAVLLHLLRSGECQGALVSRLCRCNGRLTAQTHIVTTPDEILSHASSIYVSTPVERALMQLRSFKGNVAVVGLPCQIRLLRSLAQKDYKLSQKLKLAISLFCGGVAHPRLLHSFLPRRGIQESAVNELRVRRDYLKGQFEILLDNNERVSLPFQHFNVFRMLWMYAPGKCFHCCDHAGEEADLSVGDIFLPEFRKKSIKYSAAICRSELSVELLKQMKEQKLIHLEEVTPETIFRSQKRALIFRKNIASRSLAGKLLGYRIKAPENYQVRWNDCLASFLALLNARLSSNRRLEPLLIRIPYPILKGYALLLKGLSQF